MMNLFKRIISSCLVLCMLLGQFPVLAAAEETEGIWGTPGNLFQKSGTSSLYDQLPSLDGASVFAAARSGGPITALTVGGVDALANPQGEGYSFDAETATLTLNGFRYENHEDTFGIHCTGDLTILLQGENYMDVSAAEFVINAGILVEGALTLQGDPNGAESLTVLAENLFAAILADTLFVENCDNIIGRGLAHALFAYSSLSISNSTVTGSADILEKCYELGTFDQSPAVGANGPVKISQSNVSVDASLTGINGNPVEITDGSAVTSRAQVFPVMSKGSMLIADSKLDALNTSTEEDFARFFEAFGYPIFTAIFIDTAIPEETCVIRNSQVTAKALHIAVMGLTTAISGGSTVTAEGGYAGIYSEHNICVENSTVTASNTYNLAKCLAYNTTAQISIPPAGMIVYDADGSIEINGSNVTVPQGYYGITAGNFAAANSSLDIRNCFAAVYINQSAEFNDCPFVCLEASRAVYDEYLAAGGQDDYPVAIFTAIGSILIENCPDVTLKGFKASVTSNEDSLCISNCKIVADGCIAAFKDLSVTGSYIQVDAERSVEDLRLGSLPVAIYSAYGSGNIDTSEVHANNTIVAANLVITDSTVHVTGEYTKEKAAYLSPPFAIGGNNSLTIDSSNVTAAGGAGGLWSIRGLIQITDSSVETSASWSVEDTAEIGYRGPAAAVSVDGSIALKNAVTTNGETIGKYTWEPGAGTTFLDSNGVPPLSVTIVPSQTPDPEPSEPQPTEPTQPQPTGPSEPEIIASGTYGDNLTWNLDDEGTLRISGKGPMAYAEYKWFPWHDYNADIRTVIIEEGVTNIEDYAFVSFENVCNVTIPEGVTSIGNRAFQNCSSLISITIPGSVSRIGDYAFNNCGNLSSITFEGDAPEFYRNEIFWNTKTTAYYPAGNETWTEEVRQNYGGTITWVAYGQEVPEQPDPSEPVIIASGTCGENAQWKLDENGLLTIFGEGPAVAADENGIFECPWPDYLDKITSAVVEEGITELINTFVGCEKMTTVSLPDSLMKITQAFFCCSSLTSVTIPANVSVIEGDITFVNCPKLKGVWVDENNPSFYSDEFGAVFTKDKTIFLGVPEGFPNSTYEIPVGTVGIRDFAFYNNLNLSKVTVPESVTWIGEYCFYSSHISEIVFQGNAPAFASNTFDYAEATVYYPGNDETWTEEVRQNYGGTITWVAYEKPEDPDQPEPPEPSEPIPPEPSEPQPSEPQPTDPSEPQPSVPENACGENLTWTFDETTGTLTISGTGNMYDYSNELRSPWYDHRSEIKTVVIEDGVTSIGDYAFIYCGNMTSITIPESVTTIGADAFLDCVSLTGITLPADLTFLGSAAFAGCSKLVRITIPDGITGIGESTFNGCTRLRSITLPEGLISIDEHAFADCQNLASITIPERVTTIGEGAFADCNGLSSIILPKNITSISPSLLAGCSNLRSITLPEKITGIGPSAFYNCESLTSITIPGKVTSIGSHAFDECIGLKSVTLPDGLRSIDSGAFQNCYELTSITIPTTVTTIGDHAFSLCEKLSSVTLPEGITTIENGTFQECFNLRKINIPESVSVIDDYAFAGCDGLTCISLPEGITDIGYFAFGDSGLSIVYFRGNSPYIDMAAFKNVVTTAYYPAGDKTWTSDFLLNYGGTITWVPFDFAQPEIVASGTCGEKAYWKLDENGLLTIFGEGPVIAVDGSGNFACPCPEYQEDIKSAVVEEGITELVGTFIGCMNMTSVSLPDSLFRINQAFFCCSSLTSLTIPANVSAIVGETTVAGCISMTGIWVDEDNATFCSDEHGVFYTKDKSVLLAVPAGFPETTYEIPEGTAGILAYAFHLNQNLSAVTIPESLQWLGAYCFSSGNVSEITFTGSAPAFDANTFGEVELKAYYPADDETWTEEVRQNYGGTVTWIPYGNEPECDHTYRSKVISPTCKETGYTLHTCSVCGDTYTSDEVPAHGCSFLEYHSDKNGTCIADGTKTAECDHGCGALDVIPEEDSVNPDNHTFGPWTEEGDKLSRRCTLCGHIETQIVTGGGNVDIVAPEQPDLDFDVDHVEDETDKRYILVQEAVNDAGETEQEVLKVFDINLEDEKGEHVQPNGTVKVKLPLDWEKETYYKVYRVEEDGTLTDMNATRQGSHMVFDTEHFSLYIVVKTEHEHDYKAEVTAPTCTKQGYTTHICTLCEDSYVDTYTEFTGHAYTDGICSNCGAYAVTIPAIEAAYDAEVQLWVYALIPDKMLASENAYVEMIKDSAFDGKVTTRVTAGQLRIQGKTSYGDYQLSQGMASGEMTKKVTYKFYDGKGNPVTILDENGREVGTEISYSIMDYVDRILQRGSEKQKNIVKYLVTYGGYAQNYFSKKFTGANLDAQNPAYNILLEKNIEVPSLTGVTADTITNAVTLKGQNAGIQYNGAEGYLDSAIYLRSYFLLTGNTPIDSYDFVLTYADAAGRTRTMSLTPTAAGGEYYVDIPDIPAAYLDYDYVITITNNENGETYTVTTSILAWIKNGLAKFTNEDQKNMLKAMYLYNQAANQFFGK